MRNFLARVLFGVDVCHLEMMLSITKAGFEVVVKQINELNAETKSIRFELGAAYLNEKALKLENEALRKQLVANGIEVKETPTLNERGEVQSGPGLLREFAKSMQSR